MRFWEMGNLYWIQDILELEDVETGHEYDLDIVILLKWVVR